jgi:hypothetical protein
MKCYVSTRFSFFGNFNAFWHTSTSFLYFIIAQANTPERMREKGDRAQFERWQKAGVKLPSFEKFKEIKYNGDSEGYEKLQLAYKNEKLKNEIRSGKYNLKINGQQNKHILGHHDYINGRSYLLDTVDTQKIVNKYAGTGEIK